MEIHAVGLVFEAETLVSTICSGWLTQLRGNSLHCVSFDAFAVSGITDNSYSVACRQLGILIAPQCDGRVAALIG